MANKVQVDREKILERLNYLENKKGKTDEEQIELRKLRHSESQKKYYQKNKEKCREKARAYLKFKKNKDPLIRKVTFVENYCNYLMNDTKVKSPARLIEKRMAKGILEGFAEIDKQIKDYE